MHLIEQLMWALALLAACAAAYKLSARGHARHGGRGEGEAPPLVQISRARRRGREGE